MVWGIWVDVKILKLITILSGGGQGMNEKYNGRNLANVYL